MNNDAIIGIVANDDPIPKVTIKPITYIMIMLNNLLSPVILVKVLTNSSISPVAFITPANPFAVKITTPI